MPAANERKWIRACASAILSLCLLASAAQAQLSSGDSAHMLRLPAELAPPDPREDALLCYHSGAAYFMKLPHPVYGQQDRIYQRVTTGARGHMDAFELRLHNDYPGHFRHAGTLQLSLHRLTGGMPGSHEQLIELDADTLGNETITVPLALPFHFIEGEEFFMGLSFQPAAAVDTIAYVLAPIGTYSGHSFYLEGGQVTWWGDSQGNPFGDMHFCAQVWLESAQPFLHFPWSSLDLGRGLAGQSLDISLPLVNQGTAPLVMQSVSVNDAAWSCHVEGPDSLAPADTLLLHVQWQAPNEESQSSAQLTLRCNAPNDPVLVLPLHAVSSTADLLLADWDEWECASLQLEDSTASGGWRSWSGLGRPGPFMGHDSGPPQPALADLLVLRRLRVAQGAVLRLRWVQYQRLRPEMVQHSLMWRRPGASEWEFVPAVDLLEEAFLGPENQWYQIPWITLSIPADGDLELGLLYGGTGSGDQWYVDDLELVVEGSPGTPDLGIESRCGAMTLKWQRVPGADAYAVRQIAPGSTRLLAWATGTSWTHWRAQRLQQGFYQVSAWKDDGRGLPATPEALEDIPQLEGVGP